MAKVNIHADELGAKLKSQQTSKLEILYLHQQKSLHCLGLQLKIKLEANLCYKIYLQAVQIFVHGINLNLIRSMQVTRKR